MLNDDGGLNGSSSRCYEFGGHPPSRGTTEVIASFAQGYGGQEPPLQDAKAPASTRPAGIPRTHVRGYRIP